MARPSHHSVGMIRADEAYSKTELPLRLNVSQKFWDKMIADGLPVASIGHAKWVTGRQVIEYIEKQAAARNDDAKP